MSPSAIYHHQQQQQQQQDLQQQQHSSSSAASRPSPLKIKKDSHFIQKSSSSSSSSSVASSSALSTIPKQHPHQQQQQQQQQRHPVIIYTHSPRVIHTKARDFMALVQKLTGLENDQSALVQPGGAKSGSDGNVNTNKKKLAPGRTNQDDNDSSSGLTGDENCGGTTTAGGGLLMKDVDQGIGGTNSIPAHPNHPYNMIDLPIFTPNSTTDSFYYPSSRPSFYTFPNPVISFANYMGNYNASPSFHHHQQVIKGGAQEEY